MDGDVCGGAGDGRNHGDDDDDGDDDEDDVVCGVGFSAVFG